ncbi:hypothetical protein ACLM5H_07380 [Fredinandcohnia humi]
MEPKRIQPGSEIKLRYEDKSKKILLKLWDEDGFFKEEELTNFHFTAPSEEGTYIYNIGVRWNFKSATAAVFVIEVKETE